MTIQLLYQAFSKKQKWTVIISASILLFIFINVSLDYSFSLYHNSSFYFSESLLFSSYWVLFFPLLISAERITEKGRKFNFYLLLTGLIIITHLLFYPALVWIISKIFLTHTFDYWQTLQFGLSTYAIKTVIIYGFSFVAFHFLHTEIKSSQAIKNIEEQNKLKSFITTILISEGNNSKLLLDVQDIFCFSANSPYINIYHSSKKYLHTETLKSLETQLNDKIFVRIHKSHIVNIQKISAIQSRQNGDYDILLSNNTTLRVSRNYVRNFKSKFAEQHQLTAK